METQVLTELLQAVNTLEQTSNYMMSQYRDFPESRAFYAGSKYAYWEVLALLYHTLNSKVEPILNLEVT